MFAGLRTGVVVPALNEERSIGHVVDGLRSQRNDDGTTVVDVIVVCDNGSGDQTAHRAEKHGAVVVREPRRGYGRACLSALARLREQPVDVVIFMDGDNTFDANALTGFLEQITKGADLVIGSRRKGVCEPGALSASQRFGNDLAAFLIRLFWRVSVTDLGPYRAIRSDSLGKLGMKDEAFGWTVEMQVKAIQQGMQVVEIPANARRRYGKSRISGTLFGVIKAGYGILSTIFVLRWKEHRLLKPA